MDRILEISAKIKQTDDYRLEQDAVELPLELVEDLLREVEFHFGPIPEEDEDMDSPTT